MKYHIETTQLADHYVVVVKEPITGDVIQFFTLNESGVNILKLFCELNEESVVAKRMAEIYDVPLDIITRDVYIFAKQLRKKNLL